MKIRDSYSLLLLLLVAILSGCGDDDSDDDGTLNINEIVDNVEAVSGDGDGDGDGGGSGSGAGFSGTTIGDCTRVISIISDSISSGELNSASCEERDFSEFLNGDEATDGYVVVLPSDGLVRISMTSDDFDSYLNLYSCFDASCSSFGFIQLDDDGGSGENAEIAVNVSEGTFLILASERFSSEPDGDYVLTTSFESSSNTI